VRGRIFADEDFVDDEERPLPGFEVEAHPSPATMGRHMRDRGRNGKRRRPGNGRAFFQSGTTAWGQDVLGQETTTNDRCAFVRRHRLIVAAIGGGTNAPSPVLVL
jgi:hypothetical protein